MSTTKEMFWQDSVHKYWYITKNNTQIIDNETLHQESILLNEAICEEDELRFGSFMASELKFRVSGIVQPLKDSSISLYVKLNNDNTKVAQIGKYKVVEDTPSSDRSYRDIVAYDVLYDISNSDVTEWYESLFPTDASTISVRNFRESFFNHFNLPQETATLINDEYMISKTLKGTGLTGAEVLRCLLELNGVFGRISRRGYFQYVQLPTISDANATTIATGKCIDGNYEDFTTEAITKVTVRMEDGDIGISSGEDGNEYVISGNFLLYGAEEDVVDNILSVVSCVTYRPFDATVVGNPLVELGELLKIVTKNKTIYSYVLSRSLSGIQSLKDNFVARGNKQYINNVNGIENKLVAAYGKSVKVQADLDGFKAEVQNFETSTTTSLGVIDGRITAEVSRAQSAENSISTRVDVNEQQFSVEIERIYQELDGSVSLYEVNGEPTLNNYPAWDFTYNIPCDNTVACEEVAMLYTDDYYRRNLRAVAHDMDSNQSYRFRTNNGTWYWEVIADAEYTLLVQQITELQVSVGNISTEVSTTKTNLEDLTDVVEYQGTRISQTESAITTEVARAKGAEATINTTITQTADAVRIDAQGYATTSKDEAIRTMNRELESYSKTEDMHTYVDTTAEGITTSIESSVAETYQPKTAMVNFYTKTETQQYVTQTSEAYDRTIKQYMQNGYQTLDGMSDYYTITETETKITQTYNSFLTEAKSYTDGALTGYSTITQTSSAISAAVSGKCDKTDVVNQINISTDAITISGNRLIIDSTDFKLDGNGHAEFSGIFKTDILRIGGTQSVGAMALGSDSSGNLQLVVGYSTDLKKVMIPRDTQVVGALTVTSGLISYQNCYIGDSPVLTPKNFNTYMTLSIPKATNEISGTFSSGSYGNFLYFNNSSGGGDGYYCPSTAWVKNYIKANCVMKS